MMHSLKKLGKRVAVPLLIVTFLLGIYLAAGNILDAAHVPDKKFWSPWTGWFIGLLVAAVWVPVYALVQAVTARLRASELIETEAQRDLALLCQEIVSAIAAACAEVTVNDLAACVWLCRDDDTFDEIARFYLPQQRPPTGIVWRKGRGVAGWAWKIDNNLQANLRELADELEDIGAAAFDALPEQKRFGLTASDLAKTRRYTGICAIRLFSTSAETRLLGMLILDYVGDGGFDCVAEQAGRFPVTVSIGGCAEVLTETYAKL